MYHSKGVYCIHKGKGGPITKMLNRRQLKMVKFLMLFPKSNKYYINFLWGGLHFMVNIYIKGYFITLYQHPSTLIFIFNFLV